MVGRRVVTSLALAAAMIAAAPASAATPAGTALVPDAEGQAATAWSGSVSIGPETLASDQGAGCFGADNRPKPTSGCDFFRLDVNVPAGFYGTHPGAVNISATGLGTSDLDLYVYRRNANGTRGGYVTGDGQAIGADEHAAIDRPSGAYWVVLTPYATLGPQSYRGAAELVTRRGPSLAASSSPSTGAPGSASRRRPVRATGARRSAAEPA